MQQFYVLIMEIQLDSFTSKNYTDTVGIVTYLLWQVNAHCSDRNFAYKIVEELHDPWIKRLLVGFARTSDSNGPRKPDAPPHHLIQEIDKDLPVSQPALQLTHKIFGSCPPMQSFDPAKMLNVWTFYR